MTNIHYSTYGGTCPSCQRGYTWISPLGDDIRLCAEHEALVSDAPGWSKETVAAAEGGTP